MALNIAVPLTTVGELMDGFGLLSPISPLSVDCRGVVTAGSHGKKQLVSPVGSESSGVSSLDSDEIKVRVIRKCRCYCVHTGSATFSSSSDTRCGTVFPNEFVYPFYPPWVSFSS